MDNLLTQILQLIAALTIALQMSVPPPVSPTAPSHSSPSPANSLPLITSLSPASGPVGTVVTIKGRNFTPTGNQVYAGGKPMSLPATGGTEITFTAALPGLNPNNVAAIHTYANAGSHPAPTVPLGIYVGTKIGRTSQAKIFQLEL